MHFEPLSLPVFLGQSPQAFAYSPYSYHIPFSFPFDLNRLYQDKTILSKRLADCVIYLKVLREKQAKCIRQLDVQASPSQKKRKKLQQTKRHLIIEIKNHSLAEQAYLNNLQACETNIYLANIKAYELSAASAYAQDYMSALTSYTPTLCSNSGSEATDLTRDGWIDETAASRFRKSSTYPFIVDDLAPDAYKEGSRSDPAIAKDVKQPPLCRDAIELAKSLPVPPTTAHSQHRRLSLHSPEASIIKPIYSSVVQRSCCPRSSIKKLSISNAAAASNMQFPQKRRFTIAEIAPVTERFNIVAQSPPHHLPGLQTWSHTAPHTYPQMDQRPSMNRQRTNSL